MNQNKGLVIRKLRMAQSFVPHAASSHTKMIAQHASHKVRDRKGSAKNLEDRGEGSFFFQKMSSTCPRGGEGQFFENVLDWGEG